VSFIKNKNGVRDTLEMYPSESIEGLANDVDISPTMPTLPQLDEGKNEEALTTTKEKRSPSSNLAPCNDDKEDTSKE